MPVSVVVYVRSAPMRTFLSRPYGLNLPGPASWRLGLLFGAFVFLFLAVFQPFGLGTLPQAVWPVALGYGLTCAIVMWILNTLAPRVLPQWFNEDRWTTGRQILWILVNIAVVGLGNALYTVLAGIGSLTTRTILWFEAYTLLIGVFPVTALVLWNEARLRGRYHSGSDRLNAELLTGTASPPVHGEPSPIPRQGEPGTAEVTVIVPSESGREDLGVPLGNLLFIRSAGNYLEVHYLEHGRATRKVLRGSLKRATEALAGHRRLLRCHKSHLVNLDRVDRVSGNAQGYHLHLAGGVDPVPVSRQLNDRLEDLLAGRP